MPKMTIDLNGDGCWPDIDPGNIVPAEVDGVAALSGGMTSGLPSVSFRINLPDGRVVIAQTSMRLFLAAADAFRVRFGGGE